MIAKSADYTDWSVQLAKTYKPGMRFNDEFTITRKLNGVRCTYYDGKLVSRGGKIFVGLDHIILDIKRLFAISNTVDKVVLDGELIYSNPEGLTDDEAFRKGKGIANAKNTLISKELLKFVIFDCINEVDFYLGYEHEPYWSRRKRLDNWHYNYLKDFKNIELVETVYTGTDIHQIEGALDHATINKWEGIMINLNNGVYVQAGSTNKRSSYLYKYKKFDTIDLKVIGFYEETAVDGTPKDTLGGVICEVPNDSRFKNIRVGSGFTNEERNKIWKYPAAYWGKTLECKYKEITRDKQTEALSVQFPVFLCWRDDK